MIPLDARIALLKKIHLFNELSEDELRYIAERFSEAEYEAGDVIIEQGSRGESFYLIHTGKVRIVRKSENREQQLAVLVKEDYFGEMELISNRPRTATVIALTPLIVLILSKENLDELLRKNPALKPSLDVIIRSRSLARRLQFKWLGQDEVVYFLARKHSIVLFEAMGLPALILVLVMALGLWSVFTGAIPPAVAAGILFLGDIGFAIWRAIDWSNDYYVVTNERVVWLEKVIGLYDSRQEAPLSTVLSVGVETDLLGRTLDYGDVIVRTFVGKIGFNNVPHPNQVSHVIEEYWQRTKESSANLEKEAMKDAIRAKLGLPTPHKTAATQPSPASAPTVQTRSAVLKALGAKTLKIRYEVGDTVVYRKHWFVLVRQAGLPAFFLLLLSGLLVRRLFMLWRDPVASLVQSSGTQSSVDILAVVVLPLLMLGAFLWMLYQVADWSNDVFQVTLDQIIDLDRTPFGSQQRRAAQLENILGTEYERRGLIGNIFNFGTVYITVGGTQLAFEDVLDPATVQTDIDRRRMARMAKANAVKAAAERARMADWLAAYNENADEFRRAGNDENE